MSFTVVDDLMALLAEKKRKMEQEEADTNMRILLDFLYSLSKQKLDDLNEVLEFFFVCVLGILGFNVSYSHWYQFECLLVFH